MEYDRKTCSTYALFCKCNEDGEQITECSITENAVDPDDEACITYIEND